jgi:tetratricopeptide (TPR) repeat protein
MMSIRWIVMVTFAAVSLNLGVARAEESSKQVSAQAQHECDLGRRAQDRAVKLAHFDNSQKLAERAVALDDNNADAHFALFCSVGERSRIDGEKTAAAVLGYERTIRELDRTLELNPNHLDALASKGAFLVKLPALLGGDEKKGEAMLRQVIQRDPRAISARLSLARVYMGRGQHAEALALAADALKYAQADGRADLIPEAEAAVSEVRSRLSAS